MIYYLDLMTGGIFSLRRPEDWDWERVGEGFDHGIECTFRSCPARFLGIGSLTAREKKVIIDEFARTVYGGELSERLLLAAATDTPLTSVGEALSSSPAWLCAWRDHLGRAAAAAAEFLEENEISTEPLAGPSAGRRAAITPRPMTRRCRGDS